MKVYVIYKFDDYDRVIKKIEEIKEKIGNIYFFMFPKGCKMKRWHKYAKKKMRECNMVAFFDTLTEYDSHFKHINWELSLAEKLNKKVFVFKHLEDKYSEKIYGNDYSDTQINKYKYKVKDINAAAAFFESEKNWSVDNSLMHPDSNAKDGANSDSYNQILLEQYRIMIDTSERLMDRRQSTSNLYTTICSALVAFVGATFAFGNIYVTAGICIIVGLIIALLGGNWLASLKAYELNNGGKFAVINKIEKELPADMFECEYRYNTFNGIRSYSTREKRLPGIFIGLGVIMAAAAIIALILFLIL